MRTYEDIGIQIPQVYLPRKGVNMTKWAVIACDQFTSQPEYWQQVEEIVGEAPSTFNLILPEVYLDTPSEAERAFLHDYLQREARFEVVWSDLSAYAQGLRTI